MSKGIIFLAAGGTGGHVFPAEALGHELVARDYEVHLVTDSRAERFAGKFPASKVHVVPSATISSKNPIKLLISFWRLFKGLREARRLMDSVKPIAVVGFGGYPTVPPLLAAIRAGVPTLLHEQNAVMGRANKALAKNVKAIAGGFLPETKSAGSKIVTTGNPVRPAVLAAANIDYSPSRDGEDFNLVVFGGSQGAQFFSEALPAAIKLLPQELRQRLKLTQQARPEGAAQVVKLYKAMNVEAEVSPFFGDMAERIGRAHLVISRSGASTVSELAVIGRPSILVPYPHALDHDQAANAAALQAEGGASVIRQSELTPEKLAELLVHAITSPDELEQTAIAAKKTGKPNAARTLADLVEAIAKGDSVDNYKKIKNEGVHK